MKKNCIIILLSLPVLFIHTIQGQVDTNAVNTFLMQQIPEEEKFIDLLKRNEIDSCLMSFSASVISKHSGKSLKKDMKKISILFSKYPEPIHGVSIGLSYNGIGTFGHDNYGNYEKRSVYQFRDKKGEIVYTFSLFYNDVEPPGRITYYDSTELSDFPKSKAPKLKEN